MSPRFVSSLSLFGLLPLLPSLHAQAIPGAGRFGGDLQAGAGVLLLTPDYGSSHNIGITGYVDYDVTSYLGAEVTGHFGGLHSPLDISENSYLAGPRAIYRKHNAAVYGKFLFGYATIAKQYTNESSGFDVYAFGGGLEYLLGRHINVRLVDVEQQKWPSFEPHTLSPMAVTFGVAYVLR